MSEMKKRVALVFWGLVVSGVLGVNAQAGQGEKRGPAAFSDFDVDGNGQVSEEEFNNLRAERMAARAKEGREMRGAASAPSFAEVDADGSGYIDESELSAAQQLHMAKHHGKAMGDGKGHGKGHGKGQGKGHGQGYGKGCGRGASADGSKKPCYGMQGNMPAFSDYDLDSNGGIDEAEFNKAHAERMSAMAAEGHKMKHAGDAPGFAGIDSNGDGVITEDELSAHQAEHHKKMHRGKNPENQ